VLKFIEMYNFKKCNPQEAVSIIKSRDTVFTSGEPAVLYKAILDTKDNFEDVRMYALFGLKGKSAEYIHNPEMLGHISFASSMIGAEESKRWSIENIDHMFAHFSEMEDLVRRRIKPAVVLARTCPMDDDGFFYLGDSPGCSRAAVDCNAKVVVQVDRNMPYVYTDYHRVHISEIDVLCEAENPEEYVKPAQPITAKEEKIAAFIAERIPNGATLQLGVGKVPDAVGVFLDNHKDLGVHTEAFTESMAYLMKKGAINNSKKTFLPGVSVAAFIDAGPETRKFVHKNRNILLKKLAWINSPMTVSKIHDMMSINSCLGVDLRGQVCSESIGYSFTGGPGGQLDFIEGARKSPGGKSFIVMHAAVEKKDGEKISKITLTLPAGSVVTTPRTDVMYVVTEYGVADLKYKSIKEQAQSLINIADPDFRDQLTFEARKYGLLQY